jgi:hypothetical protein
MINLVPHGLSEDSSLSRPRSQEVAFVPVIRDEDEASKNSSNPTEKQMRRRTK